MKLNNVRLLVSHFDQTFLFYRDVLGFVVTWGNLGENYAQFDNGSGSSMSIFLKELMSSVVGTTNLPEKSQAQDGITLIFAVENLDGLYRSLLSKGVKFINPPTDQPDWGIRVAHCRDPEGNLIELMMELPKEKMSEELQEDFQKYSCQPAQKG